MKIIYIDTQNIHKAIEELGWILDWKLFYIYLNEKFAPAKIKMFVGYIKKHEKFYQEIQAIGYEVIFKKTSQRLDGTIKGNIDVDLTMSVMDDLHLTGLTFGYIVSGDSDYNTLIERLKIEGKFGRLIVPNLDKTSSHLRHVSGNNIQSITDLKHRLKKEVPVKETSLGGGKQSPHSSDERRSV